MKETPVVMYMVYLHITTGVLLLSVVAQSVYLEPLSIIVWTLDY